MRTLIFDVETYHNFWLVAFRDVETKEFFDFPITDRSHFDNPSLLRMLTENRLVGFNSAEYDIPMIQLALKGLPPKRIKEASDRIILGGATRRDIAQDYGLQYQTWNHIDIMNVAPLKGSLKIYGGRLHCRKMQDLPIDPNKIISPEEEKIITTYCHNDLEVTELLWFELREQIKLREVISKEYGVDVRSRSDAQVAEHIIVAEISKLNGEGIARPEGLEGTAFSYKIPDFISYKHPALRDLLEKVREAKFVVAADGSCHMPEQLNDLAIDIGKGKYRIGIGGLHSSETQVCHTATKDTLLIDRDVASYYPRIILNQGLYPKHLGEAFLTVYRTLVERRLVAKKAGDKSTAESLKIAINGSFGKLGNKWSYLYSPDLLIQVTMTGQLALLMLIEWIEEKNIPVISANTDGIVIKCPASQYEDILLPVFKLWEKTTGFETEETRYRALYSKDVNNYIAIKKDGTVKGKGLYACPWNGITEGPSIFKFHKNPSTTIVIEAVINLLRDGIPLYHTIRQCKDITKFLSVRSVTGGAHSKGDYVGKAVRWYYSTSTMGNTINYKKSGNKVPKTDGAKPLMELPATFPKDVNYEWYLNEAQYVLVNIGYAQLTLF